MKGHVYLILEHTTPMRAVINSFALLGTAFAFAVPFADAGGASTDFKPFPGWKHAIAEMRGKPVRRHSHRIARFETKLAQFNAAVNAVDYVNDDYVYDEHNYWPTPSQFYRWGGECRDYAVAKYYRLYALGLADADMEVAVVRIKKTGEDHAVLLVRYGAKTYVLDNRFNRIQPPERMDDFAVYYYINRIAWRAGASVSATPEREREVHGHTAN
jgi:predicted transglutaminase-like cysteine proteinase